MIEPAEPSPEQSVSIPEQSAPTSAASIPQAATSPAALAAGPIEKLKAGPGTMIKRPAACQSDAEPAPKKPKTKPPTAPATMGEPALLWKERSKLRSEGAKEAQSRSCCPLCGVGPNMPLGAFTGVPKHYWPPRKYKDFHIYTLHNSGQWRARFKRAGESHEIPFDAHDNYLLCGTTAFRYHRIFLGASGCAFKRKILYWDSYMHCLGQDLTREAEQSFSAWSGGIQAKLSDIVHAWSRFLANCQKHN